MIGSSLLLAASRRSSLLDGLIGYWPMNGNGNDVVGTNHGTLAGSGGSFGAGKINQAFYAGGSARYDIGSALKPRNAITVGAWYLFNAVQSGNARLSADWHQNGATGDRWIMPYSPDGSTLTFHAFNHNSSLGAISNFALPNHFPPLTWVLLAGTWDQVTGLKRGLVNGVLAQSDGGFTTALPAGVSLSAVIGGQSSGFPGLNGRVCEFAMWETAKTEAELFEWHNAGAGKTHPF